MLHIIGLILLWILRIIGILLAVLLILLLMIIFTPICYDARGVYDESVDVKVRFSWLLYIINGSFIYDEDGPRTKVRLTFFKVFSSGGKDEEDAGKKKEAKKPAKVSPKAKEPDKKIRIPVEEEKKKETISDIGRELKKEIAREIKEEIDKETGKTTEKEVETKKKAVDEVKIEEDRSEKQPEEKTEKKTVKNKKGKKAKKKEEKKEEKKKNESMEKAKDLWAFLHEPRNEGLLRHVTKYVVKLLKWILPRKVLVDMEIGLEDPAVTGYIAGVASILYVKTRKNIHVMPNFQEQVIKGRFKIIGRLYLCQPLYYIIRVIIDRRVRRLIKKVRN